jgi:hypothetical protein
MNLPPVLYGYEALFLILKENVKCVSEEYAPENSRRWPGRK